MFSWVIKTFGGIFHRYWMISNKILLLYYNIVVIVGLQNFWNSIPIEGWCNLSESLKVTLKLFLVDDDATFFSAE